MNLNKFVKYESVRIAIVNLRLYYMRYSNCRRGGVLDLDLGERQLESHGCTFYFIFFKFYYFTWNAKRLAVTQVCQRQLSFLFVVTTIGFFLLTYKYT